MTTQTPDEFLAGDVLVYAFTSDPRSAKVQQLLERGCISNVQVLNEFSDVARRKLNLSWTELTQSLEDIRTVCPTILPLTADVQASGVELAERHGLSVFDGLIVASALDGGCSPLWPEAMQHGLVVAKKLRIQNPFRGGVNP